MAANQLEVVVFPWVPATARVGFPSVMRPSMSALLIGTMSPGEMPVQRHGLRNRWSPNHGQRVSVRLNPFGQVRRLVGMDDIHAFCGEGLQQGRWGQVVPSDDMAQGVGCRANALMPMPPMPRKNTCLLAMLGMGSVDELFQFIHNSRRCIWTRRLFHGKTH